MLIGYRTGDMWAPRLETVEAPARRGRPVVRAIQGGEPPATDGHAGLRVVEILEAATRSMADRGRPAELR